MSIMRLLVCGGLFALGYYLGRQSSRLESFQGQSEELGNPGPVPGAENVNPDKGDQKP